MLYYLLGHLSRYDNPRNGTDRLMHLLHKFLPAGYNWLLQSLIQRLWLQPNLEKLKQSWLKLQYSQMIHPIFDPISHGITDLNQNPITYRTVFKIPGNCQIIAQRKIFQRKLKLLRLQWDSEG